MSLQICISDALKRRIGLYSDARYLAFTKAAADIARGRARGKLVNRSLDNQREMYALTSGEAVLFYSIDPKIGSSSLVFEEYLSAAEAEAYLDAFTEGRS